ncbi:MAG: hypothetical protein IJQ80_03825 [Clostridia bacterium]|nr:hypothetical protein [Clostridia bacterium]
MKKISKKKKIILSFLTAFISVLVIVILIAALSSGKKEPDLARTDDTTGTETEITVDTVTPESVEPEETDDETEEISDDGAMLTIEEPEVVTPDTDNVIEGEAGTPATSSEENTPPDDGNGNGGGISIGGGTAEPYNCGAANHHCDGPETHAFIQNLEIEGCPFCGSHSCPSFYATDAWGFTCYTPSVCPSYDIRRDPVYYCQSCGKPCGDGKNGTCVQFVNDCNCPNCGEAVSAWTCHSCK